MQVTDSASFERAAAEVQVENNDVKYVNGSWYLNGSKIRTFGRLDTSCVVYGCIKQTDGITITSV